MRRRGERGSVLIESAFVMLVIATLLMGAAEIGLIVTGMQFAAYAPAEGVRYASVHGSESGAPATSADVDQYVRSLGSGFNAEQLEVETVWSDPQHKPGSEVRVEVRYRALPATGLLLNRPIVFASAASSVVGQ